MQERWRMDGSGSGSGKVFGRFSAPAHRVLDLAREEAERFGHRYLGPEHVLLGMLTKDQSQATRVLRVAGVDLAAARAATRRLTDRRVVPPPRRSRCRARTLQRCLGGLHRGIVPDVHDAASLEVEVEAAGPQHGGCRSAAAGRP
jgi:hypothetical protein